VLVLAWQTSLLFINGLAITALYLLDSHWGVELLSAPPFEHVATGKGAIQGVDVTDF
jgi:hypothetical protein